MRNVINMLKRFYNRTVAAYAVIVDSPELPDVVIHYAWDMQDALEWAACYGHYDYVEIRPAFLGIIGNAPLRTRGCPF